VRPRMTHTLTRKGMTKSEARSTLESLCYLRVVTSKSFLTASLCVGSGATQGSQAWGHSSAGLWLVVCVLHCGSLASLYRGGWFCLWALNLVEDRGGCACGETSFSRGCSVFLVVTPGCSFRTSWRSGMLVLVS
ncbi:hypothetical protein Taro_056236, partial [Colocasia esculenta]|nr:hypothetical protein [Colocasia esculenta]